MKNDFDKIKVGSTVTIRVYAGMGMNRVKEYKEKPGRAVMKGPHGWVINMGGPHGTPGICDRESFVRLGGKDGKA